ncbi:unnamed protein product [Agarophyton chilense]
MIVIPLKSQYVSLIFTIISGASELALLSATQRWNCFYENKSLQQGRKVNVRHHLTRTKLLIACATSAFFIIEIANSFYSDPITIERSETRPCSFLASADFRANVTKATLEFHPISLSCLEANETSVWQRGGNRFETDEGSVIQCSETMYSFDREIMSEEPIPDNFVVECVPAPQLNVKEENPEACSFWYQNGNRVTFSDFVTRSDLANVLDQSESIHVWHTDVAFDVAGRERELASRAAFHLSRGEADDVGLRRKIFSRDGDGMCEFTQEVDATALNVAFVSVLVSLWVLCLFVFVVGLLFQSRIMYDMSDPLDWASKTVIGNGFIGAENPEASSVEHDGRRFVVLSNSREVNGRWLLLVPSRKGLK